MDQLNKMKAKYGKSESEIKLVQYLPVCRVVKDCGQIANEIGDVRAATDEVARSKVSWEIQSVTSISS